MEILQLPQTTISKALGVLKKAGFVQDKKDGRWVRYRVVVPSNKFPLKSILTYAASDPIIYKDLKRLEKIKKVPLDKISCDKPWRK